MISAPMLILLAGVFTNVALASDRCDLSGRFGGLVFVPTLARKNKVAMAKIPLRAMVSPPQVVSQLKHEAFSTPEGLAKLSAQLAKAQATPKVAKTFKRTQPKSHWM